MKAQQQFRGLFKFLFVVSSLLIVTIVTIFAMGKMEILSFLTSISTNILTLIVAVMMLRKGREVGDE